MSTFVKGLAWIVALLSGIATIFALFGGQQWLEQQGWTLAPSTAPTAEAEPDAEPTASEVAQEATADEGDGAQGPSDEGAGFSWDAVLAWSEGTFDNLLWGIAAIGFSMLLAGAAGAAALHATVEATYVLLVLPCIAAVVLMGVLLHAADPGYLLWFIILTALSAPVGFFAPVYADS